MNLHVHQAISILDIIKPNFYPSKFKIFCECVGELEKKEQENDYLLMGICMERTIDNYIEEKFQWRPQKIEEKTHPNLSYLIGTPDRICDINGKKYLLEYKNISNSHLMQFWKENGQYILSEYARVQLLLYLDIFGISEGYVVASFYGRPPEFFHVVHEAKEIENYLKQINDFWNIVQIALKIKEKFGHIPQHLYPNDYDKESITQITEKRKDLETLEIDNKELDILCFTLDALKTNKKEIDEKIDKVENKIKFMMQNYKRVTTSQNIINYGWINHTKPKINLSKLQKEYPQFYEELLEKLKELNEELIYYPKYRRLYINPKKGGDDLW